MKNFVGTFGDAHLTIADGCTSGALVAVGSLVGVAHEAAASGASIKVELAGIYSLTKETSVNFTQGGKAYRTSTGTVTTASTGNTLCGVAVAAATTAATSVNVMLIPGIGVTA